MTLPHSLELEMCVLGTLLLSARVCEEQIDRLDKSDFWFDDHRLIFGACQALHQHGKRVDPITVLERLKQTEASQHVSMELLMGITEYVISVQSADTYVGMLIAIGDRRRIIEAARLVIAEALDPKTSLDISVFAENAFADASRVESASTVVPSDIAVFAMHDRLVRIMEGGSRWDGIATGFQELDSRLLGLATGELVILGARPGVGKSALAARIALNAAHATKKPAFVFSMEMEAEQVVARLVSSLADVPLSQMKTKGELSRERLDLIEKKGMSHLIAKQLIFDEADSVSPSQMLRRCRSMARQHGDPCVVVVDYLQLCSAPTKTSSRYEEVSAVARGLKQLARKLGVPVIALSQLSRDSTKGNRRPNIADLRDSGEIEAAADKVLLLHRENMGARDRTHDEFGTEIVEVLVEKNRQGSTGTTYVAFKPSTTAFLRADPLSVEAYLKTVGDRR